MPSTRHQVKADSTTVCHTLNYFYDKQNGFSMTNLVNTVRFHIIVDFDRLGSKDVQQEYVTLLNAVKGKKGPSQSVNRKRKRDDGTPESTHQTDSGYGSSPVKSSPRSTISQHSSGIELAQDDREDNEAVRDLQNWALKPFETVFASEAPASNNDNLTTVHDWYHSPAKFYTLTCDSSGTLKPESDADTDGELARRIEKLVPSVRLPKYITSHSIPIFKDSDLKILQTSSSPSPEHPCLVQSLSTNEEMFLKLVDPSQPGPVKREIKMLKLMEERDLYAKICAPHLLGVVVVDSTPSSTSSTGSASSTTTTTTTTTTTHNSRTTTSPDQPTTILGFLLTPIPSPTPLSLMLDTDTADALCTSPHSTSSSSSPPKTNRDTWLASAETYIHALHAAGLTWGDVKAENFLIDTDARIWMIDFGGSYTEGWVDEKLCETVEGDLQGLSRVVEAVGDPEGFFAAGEVEAQQEEERKVKRRKRNVGLRGVKAGSEKGEEEVYCYCGAGEKGHMIACDGAKCEREWFHVECTGLENMPGDDEKWFCKDCCEGKVE